MGENFQMGCLLSIDSLPDEKGIIEPQHKTSSPKGNDAHLRVIKQSEKEWKHQFFRRLRAANSVVRGRI